MSTAVNEIFNTTPAFCEGILHFADAPEDFAEHGQQPAIADGAKGIDDIDSRAVFQTRLLADALRYATLQLCASKESGHPGGFASSADAYAALTMLGHTNIVTEVGHHAPGFYSAMFIDGSLEDMGIHTMQQLQARFRERDGLLGHLSGAIPGLLAPAGPLGQGQHFAMAAAYLNWGFGLVAGAVLALLANDRVILLWIVSLRGEPLPSPLYWVAPLIGTAVWPWLFLLLDRYRGVMRQRAAR